MNGATEANRRIDSDRLLQELKQVNANLERIIDLQRPVNLAPMRQCQVCYTWVIAGQMHTCAGTTTRTP